MSLIEEIYYRVDIDDYWTKATSAEADTYFAARGTSTWTGTDEVKTQALQRAWDYMRTLKWIDGVFLLAQPDDITNAHILLAHEELKSSGILTPALTSNEYADEVEVVGAIKIKYRTTAPQWTKFRGVEMLLAPYIKPDGSVEMRRG